jgi:hypothetical protein
MKNLLLLMLLAVAFIVAASGCSSSHKVQGTNVEGTWTLNNVDVEGANITPRTKITLFDDVNYTCFNGSTWKLPSNGNGTYTVSATGDCAAGDRTIVWSIFNTNGVDYVQFKRTGGGVKAKTIDAGYRMEVTNASENAMVLRAPINIEGRSGFLVYRFSK